MKKTIYHGFRCILILAIVSFSIWSLGYLFRPTNTDISVASIKAFRDMPQNSIDVIFFGSSHAWKGVNTQVMFEEYGIECYNYACNWQHLNTTRLFVHDSFTVQKPKVVFVETYKVNMLLRKKSLNGEIYYTRPLPSSDIKKEYLNETLGTGFKKQLPYYVPFVSFHSNWDAFTFAAFSLDDKGVDFDVTRGFCPSDGTRKIKIFNPDEAQKKDISTDCVAVLDDIVSICNENGAQLVFFTLPSAFEDPYEEQIEEYSKNNNCTYINLFRYVDEVGLDGETDFSDTSHLNTSGATKVGRFFGQYISDNKLLGE